MARTKQSARRSTGGTKPRTNDGNAAARVGAYFNRPLPPELINYVINNDPEERFRKKIEDANNLFPVTITKQELLAHIKLLRTYDLYRYQGFGPMSTRLIISKIFEAYEGATMQDFSALVEALFVPCKIVQPLDEDKVLIIFRTNIPGSMVTLKCALRPINDSQHEPSRDQRITDWEAMGVPDECQDQLLGRYNRKTQIDLTFDVDLRKRNFVLPFPLTSPKDAPLVDYYEFPGNRNDSPCLEMGWLPSICSYSNVLLDNEVYDDFLNDFLTVPDSLTADEYYASDYFRDECQRIADEDHATGAADNNFCSNFKNDRHWGAEFGKQLLRLFRCPNIADIDPPGVRSSHPDNLVGTGLKDPTTEAYPSDPHLAEWQRACTKLVMLSGMITHYEAPGNFDRRVIRVRDVCG